MKRDRLRDVFLHTVFHPPLRFLGLLTAVGGSVALALIPPLVLGRIVDGLTGGGNALGLALLYFGTLAASGIFDAWKESAICILGQSVTCNIRHAMFEKLRRMDASCFIRNDPGVMTARFMGDVDTVETLFASGMVGMLVDGCKMLGILVMLLIYNRGLGLLMLAVTPLLFLFTRTVQKRMLQTQLRSRAAAGNITGFLPQTVRCIRMIHVFRKETYMEHAYGRRIEEGYRATDRANFYDAIYSPVIVVISTAVVAIMMTAAAQGGAWQSFFGMTVGTAVTAIAYVGRVFGPLESIGMEIQSIQSALAGMRRIRSFFAEPERPEADPSVRTDALVRAGGEALSLSHVCFSYEEGHPVLRDYNLSLAAGASATLAGRTGIGKSTVLRLLLGLYAPGSGAVRVFGADPRRIPPRERRRLLGYVEQSFRPVPGTVYDQVAVYDETLTADAVRRAAAIAGIDAVIAALPQSYETPYSDGLFSQGQRQLLAIARAVAGDPAVLLLDEITASLDGQTELAVMQALRAASHNRSVLSVSHRLHGGAGGSVLHMHSPDPQETLSGQEKPACDH